MSAPVYSLIPFHGLVHMLKGPLSTCSLEVFPGMKSFAPFPVLLKRDGSLLSLPPQLSCVFCRCCAGLKRWVCQLWEEVA